MHLYQTIKKSYIFTGRKEGKRREGRGGREGGKEKRGGREEKRG